MMAHPALRATLARSRTVGAIGALQQQQLASRAFSIGSFWRSSNAGAGLADTATARKVAGNVPYRPAPGSAAQGTGVTQGSPDVAAPGSTSSVASPVQGYEPPHSQPTAASLLANTQTAREAAQQIHYSPATGNGSGSSSGGSPPPPRKKRGFFKTLKRAVGTAGFVGLASLGYFIFESNNPPTQLPTDPTKKTIVILGSGWGSTALLKSIDTTEYNVVVISPHNYFLFTPLLPSVTVGTLNGRSIAQPTRHTTRYKTREVQVLEAEATKVDVKNKTVTFEDRSEIHGNLGTVSIGYDYLVYAVGSENQTFGIEGVRKHACFLKELRDAEKIRNRLMDCVETASLIGQSDEEIDRLLHIVVVGGGPTGVEAAGELRDFVEGDLSKWYPAVSNRVRVTLIEALPQILPMFSKNLIEYTEHVFQENKITLLTKHQVLDLDEEGVTVKAPNGEKLFLPCGMLLWAAGNTARPLTRDLMSQLPEAQTERRGLKVDKHMRLLGAEDSVFAIGDAAVTGNPPTAQVANQHGTYLAEVFNRLARVEQLERQVDELRTNSRPMSEIVKLERKIERLSRIQPFKFSNAGQLAYIGADKAIADLPFVGDTNHVAVGGILTYLFWRSAYWSMLLGLRNRASVLVDWAHVGIFGRDVSRNS